MAVEGALAAVLQGRSKHLVSFAGQSQYGGGGSSACGLAALNFARIILEKERDGLKDVALLQEMTRDEVIEDVLRICSQWSSTAHLDVDEIATAPIFENTLEPLWSQYSQLGRRSFREMLIKLHDSTTSSAALVLTRPPEIVCVLKVVTEMKAVYALFDSHPRHHHPDGAAVVFFPSLDAAAEYLSDLFEFDQRLLSDASLQWETQLLANYCGHAFNIKDNLSSVGNILDVVMDASLKILSLKADLAELERSNTILRSEVESLSDANARMQNEVIAIRASTTAHPFSSMVNSFGGMWRTTPSRPTPGPSTSQRPTPNKAPLEWQEATDEQDASALLAVKMQKEFEEEDSHLNAIMQDLQKAVPQRFHCGICLDEYEEDMVARIESCGHKFCRDCIRGFIQVKLGEHRFPIFCPTCIVDREKSDPGTLSTILVQQIGLSEEEFNLFTELELSVFSILLHCRKCQQAVFVDKAEYEAQDLIVCPLPRCNYIWCKNCSRAIDVNGPRHSCDGSSELNHLMSQRGWKHCPGCRTPTEKMDGCNHMTCPSPGCNTHFCYVCGESIVQSVMRREIQTALSNHYARCNLFNYP
ncbi:hypothetical protein BXZ70DRAFT_896170 [Cristinia sonorae]|uniref:RBR-type E3 ubiquitin transferase n=1 Tax=Cristinia sonorae TaxID=1940300 RepID=A0A8K0UJR7_9AGAR|nr:hypothetical protein BXZ70DRAFT_896170 [Cristinia sonorae]